MAVLKRIKRQEIPFILDGKTIIKCVTKDTTCSDVINKLPNLETPLAVFESVDGIEKELTGKTKLLKVWRANGATRKVEFVIRKSQIFSKDKQTSKQKLLSGVTKCKQSSAHSAQTKGLSKETLKQVSDLAFYVRYQKTKLQALDKNFGANSGASEQNRLMKRMTSNASVNSMDAFLAKADLNEMAKFLTFCGDVATDKLNNGKQRKLSTPAETNIHDKKVTRESLKSTKLGFKQKFTVKKTVERTISAGTISSTDTGYHSIDSGCESLVKTSSSSIGEPKHHAPIHTNITDVPRHSTPIIAVRTQKRRADDFDTTFNADNTLLSKNIEQMNEIQGKSVILQKFMADQPLSASTRHTGNDCDSPDVKRRRIGRYSTPAFGSQEDVCRFLWDNNCDSDSECESDISEPCEDLDKAFNAGGIDSTIYSHTLRRESAVSDLKRISLASRVIDVNEVETEAPETKTLRRESAISNLNKFSLLSRDIGLDTLDDSNGFDYSFDCSFPRMEETKSEDFSMDFSYDYDESDSESEALCNEDDCMDSFMKTKSFIDVSGDATVCEFKNDMYKSCANSDEGLGSICSGSMTNCQEPEMII
jgi:hypothetical protein